MIFHSTIWMYHKSTHLQLLGWSLDLSSECESWQTVRGSVLNALQLSEWTASGRPRLLLFTFPATYSYLLLITLPPSVVTKTQSNLPGSAWHHTDRRTLTHFVGELADGFLFISFPFFSPSQAKSALLSGSLTGWCFRTKDNRVGWITTIKKNLPGGRREEKVVQYKKEKNKLCDAALVCWPRGEEEGEWVWKNKTVWKYPDGVGGLSFSLHQFVFSLLRRRRLSSDNATRFYINPLREPGQAAEPNQTVEVKFFKKKSK